MMDLGHQMEGGTLPTLPAGASLDEQATVLNNIITRLNDMLKAQVYSDTASKRFVQGYMPGRWPGGDFGIAISAEGEDVVSADFDDLIFAWHFTTNKQYIRDGAQVYYNDGVPREYAGNAPSDGRYGRWISEPGKDVMETIG